MVLKIRKSVAAIMGAALVGVCVLVTLGHIRTMHTSRYALGFGQDNAYPLLISLFQNNVQDAAQLFYADYYSVVPIVDPWDITIVGIQKEENSFTITFGAKPYLGPHDTIGYDEITFAVLNYGTAQMIEYRHIKNYELPENLKSLQIKEFET